MRNNLKEHGMKLPQKPFFVAFVTGLAFVLITTLVSIIIILLC